MNSRRTLLDAVTIGAAAGPILYGETAGLHGLSGLAVEANFTYVGGGTDVTAHVQTSLDGGVNWIDIMAFHFLTTSLRTVQAVTHGAILAAYTPLVVALTDDTAIDFILGDMLQVSLTSTGIYTGATLLTMNALPKFG